MFVWVFCIVFMWRGTSVRVIIFGLGSARRYCNTVPTRRQKHGTIPTPRPRCNGRVKSETGLADQFNHSTWPWYQYKPAAPGWEPSLGSTSLLSSVHVHILYTHTYTHFIQTYIHTKKVYHKPTSLAMLPPIWNDEPPYTWLISHSHLNQSRINSRLFL